MLSTNVSDNVLIREMGLDDLVKLLKTLIKPCI